MPEARPSVREIGGPSTTVPPADDGTPPSREREYQMLLHLQQQHLQNTNRLSYQLDELRREVQEARAATNATRDEMRMFREEKSLAKGFFARFWDWLRGK